MSMTTPLEFRPGKFWPGQFYAWVLPKLNVAILLAFLPDLSSSFEFFFTGVFAIFVYLLALGLPSWATRTLSARGVPISPSIFPWADPTKHTPYEAGQF